MPANEKGVIIACSGIPDQCAVLRMAI